MAQVKENVWALLREAFWCLTPKGRDEVVRLTRQAAHTRSGAFTFGELLDEMEVLAGRRLGIGGISSALDDMVKSGEVSATKELRRIESYTHAYTGKVVPARAGVGVRYKAARAE
jgi:hypothetical protein